MLPCDTHTSCTLYRDYYTALLWQKEASDKSPKSEIVMLLYWTPGLDLACSTSGPTAEFGAEKKTHPAERSWYCIEMSMYMTDTFCSFTRNITFITNCFNPFVTVLNQWHKYCIVIENNSRTILSAICVHFYIGLSLLVDWNEFPSIFHKVQHFHSRHQKTSSNLLRTNVNSKLRLNKIWPLEEASVHNSMARYSGASRKY